MITNIFERLNPQAYFPTDVMGQYDKKYVEAQLGALLPPELIQILDTFKGAISFENNCYFIQKELSTIEGCKVTLDIMYGFIGNVNFGIVERNLQLETHDFFPSSMIAFATTPGGDQICLCKKTMNVFHWKHDVGADERESLTKLSDSFLTFLDSLQVDEESAKPLEDLDLGLLDNGSYLDF